MSASKSAGRAGNLPAELTSFIGRRHEIAEIKRLLSASRLVTLTGVGGAGKTRLSLRAAADLQRAFSDGVWLVELAALEDQALLSQTIASTLGLHDRTARWPVPALAEYLSDKRLLLVLDNCEHLRDACAVLVDTVLHAAPDVHILATSRQALGLTGEHIFQVPTMSMPEPDRPTPHDALGQYEAVNLFVDRAVAVRPDFEVTTENADTIVRVCQRLDGIPLAIELTAVRLRALDLGDLLDRLEDRFRLLTAGSPGVLPRHQTLRALIDWSNALCSERESIVWARLSVFSGGFDLTAAEAVCSDETIPEEDVVGLLAALVDKSIVIAEHHNGRLRYRLLETIRQYGLERLAANGDETAVRARHRDYFVGLVERAFTEWLGPDQETWLTTLLREHNNLRAAFEFCLTSRDHAATGVQMAGALWFFWIATGLTNEGRRWLERGLDVSGEASPVRARALWVCGYLCTIQEDLTAARPMIEECRSLGEQLDDVDAAAWAVQLTGMMAMSAGELADTRDALSEALERHRTNDNPLGILDTSFYLVVVTALLGELQDAVRIAEDAIALCDSRGERWLKSYMLWDLSLVAWQQSDYDKAAASAMAGLRLAREFNEQWVIAFCFEILAWTAHGERTLPRAARLFGAADRLWRRIGAPLFGMRHLVTFHEQQQEQAREALGGRRFDADFRDGTLMSTDDSIAFALDERELTRETTAASRHDTTLTRREREVANLIADGLSNKEIATKLVIARRTAEAHVEHILGKLGFSSRSQVAAWVAEQRGTELSAHEHH
ncbi:ATP-binding protein [Haloechinothrix salitolerans]|uniref:ATP-binding protein n=1 Tax=Haloechinothrix salitolerans TaxID=926830 RepID=A0ABW2C1Y9_9PSEU